jgi:uncharacterized Zn finger protein
MSFHRPPSLICPRRSHTTKGPLVEQPSPDRPVSHPNSMAGTDRSGFEGLHAAELACETCGIPTRHRILRIGRERRTANGRIVEGTARCSQCRWTHPFELELPDELSLPAVLSEGTRSTPLRVWVPANRRLVVGSRLPDQERPLRIVRMDARSGARTSDAVAHDVATLWLTPDGPRPIPVSLVLGAKTAVTRAEVPPDEFLEVGETVHVAGGTLRVVGLRARNRTWTHVGDRFPARDVARIYTRRMESPPAGNSRWSRSRERPSSRTTSTSWSDRSRSSPGARTRRRRPRARRDDGGAAVQSDSPS